MTRRHLTMTAAIAVAATLCSAGAVLAIEAEAKSAVNVRTGPGTNFGIVDQLTAGEVVEVTECVQPGWCFIEHTGPDGWVSASFLLATNASEDEVEQSEDDPDCSFGFTLGPNGPTMSIQCGDQPFPEPDEPPPPVEDAEACFYVGENFSGQQFCMGEGVRNTLNAQFNNRISSVELFGGARVRLCANNNLGGVCRNINNDAETLNAAIDNKGSSLIVYTGALPDLDPEPEPEDIPVTHSTGPIDLKQTFTANLDNGNIGGNGTDIFYQAVTNFEKYITPINGALVALGNGSNRGYAGCSVEDFDDERIPLAELTPGTYVCVRTNQGRISQFRVNSYQGTTMKIGYTTWAN